LRGWEPGVAEPSSRCGSSACTLMTQHLMGLVQDRPGAGMTSGRVLRCNKRTSMRVA
jgi:hypothetical protein